MAIDNLSEQNPPVIVPGEVHLETTFGGYFLEASRITEGCFVTRYRDPKWGLGWILLQDPLHSESALDLNDVERVAQLAFLGPGMGVLLLTHEASRAFHPHLRTAAGSVPFNAWAAQYGSHAEFFKELAPTAEAIVEIAGSDFTPGISFDEAFSRVKESLASGETYQVNLTERLRFQHMGTAWELFVSRVGVQPTPYATFVAGPGWDVASWSPELFVERRDGFVRMKPMKGTADRSQPQDSLCNEKTFAENLMIVDMVRNDLGQVAKVGSVSVPTLFHVEAHRSVWQMTSTVQATSDADGFELLKAVFPPASVTGAPKASACGVIERLEKSPRGLYCGALGFVTSSGDFRLSVGIRTAILQSGSGEYGIGSGIVWDSNSEDEFLEWMLKSQALIQPAEPWALLETLGSESLDDPAPHLRRLEASCRALGVKFDGQLIRRALAELDVSGVDLASSRVRLRMSSSGSATVALAPAKSEGHILRYRIAKWPVSSLDPGLSHKSTSRQVYQEHLDAASDCDEVLLYNERGEATEFATGALVVRSAEQWLTPPTRSGCLPSVGVQRLGAVHQVILVDAVKDFDEVWMVNARGRWRMSLSN